MLKFITGNQGKFNEVSAILSPLKVEKISIDLDEIQELDRRAILNHKVLEALKHQQSNFIIEDTCTYFDCLKGQFPGPFAKWFIDVYKPVGLYELCKKMGNTKAHMITTIAYVKNKKSIYFFEGRADGKMVKPRGKFGFGLDPIFMPNGSTKTFAEMKGEGFTKYSARTKATFKLKKFLQS